MADIRYDREMARAFVEAGYMSLKDYIDLYGPMIEAEARKPSVVERLKSLIWRRDHATGITAESTA